MNKKKWKEYWNNQNDPRHSANNDIFFKNIAKEIEFHLGDISNKKILELGCGDGSILKHLPISPKQYMGIDFSQSLLEKFKHDLPDHNIEKTGALEYLKKVDNEFDIIFSFGVLQYFDERKLKELFTAQEKALTKNGLAVHFGVPIIEQKNVFTSGQGTQVIANFKKRFILKRIKAKFFDNIGHWHNLRSLYSTSTSSGFNTTICGGINYLYRINIIQIKKT